MEGTNSHLRLNRAAGRNAEHARDYAGTGSARYPRGSPVCSFLVLLLRALLRDQWLAGTGFALLFRIAQFFAKWKFVGRIQRAAVLIYGIIAVVMLR